MKLRLLSDLHLNIHPWKYTSAGEDAVLIAGDTSVAGADGRITLLNFLRDISVPVYIIAGNHEAYGISRDDDYRGSIGDYSKVLARYTDELENVHWLDASCAKLTDNVKIFGATMYTDFRAAGEADSFFVKLHWSSTADMLNNPSAGDEYPRLATRHRAALNDALESARRSGDKLVVMTHWVPSMNLIAGRYRNDGVCHNAAFVCACDDIIAAYSDTITAWFYGHTHIATDRVMAGVHFVSNPRGYFGEYTGWKKNKMIII
jgi:predicted phosphohydrolase